MTATAAYAAANETNGLVDHAAYHAADRRTQVALDDPRLDRVTRLRLLTDPGFPNWELSYCHGVLVDGTEVTVVLPWHSFSKRKGLAREIVTMCKEVGVYAKGVGILDAISTLR